MFQPKDKKKKKNVKERKKIKGKGHVHVWEAVEAVSFRDKVNPQNSTRLTQGDTGP